jgi:looped-hinge helix DNA binding domain, AbrB family
MADTQNHPDKARADTRRNRRVLPALRNVATVRAKGGVTIPQQLREQVHLEEGDQVIVTVQDGSIVLTPAAVIPRDQQWFWTTEWQAKEAEADADKAAGRFIRHTSDADFLASLDED